MVQRLLMGYSPLKPKLPLAIGGIAPSSSRAMTSSRSSSCELRRVARRGVPARLA
jgi:hypothetical protein